MDKRVILITGGNGQLGSEIGRVFLSVTTNDIVWLAIHKNSERAEALAAKFPGTLPDHIARCDEAREVGRMPPRTLPRTSPVPSESLSIMRAQTRRRVAREHAG